VNLFSIKTKRGHTFGKSLFSISIANSLF